MIDCPNLRYDLFEPPFAQITSATAVTQFTIFVIFECACSEWPTGLRYFNMYASSQLLRLMVPRRVPRAISPIATLRRAYILSISTARPHPSLPLDQNQAASSLKPPPHPHRLFDLQDYLDNLKRFLVHLSDFVPLKNGVFYSFRAQTD